MSDGNRPQQRKGDTDRHPCRPRCRRRAGPERAGQAAAAPLLAGHQN